MKRIPPPASVIALLALAVCTPACSPAGNDPGPGGVTVDEAAALDEAAEMIEAQRLPAGTLPESRTADKDTQNSVLDEEGGETAPDPASADDTDGE